MSSRTPWLIGLAFVFMAIVMEAALAWYWTGILQPRLQHEARQQAQILGQAQIPSLLAALREDDAQLRRTRLEATIDELLLRDQTRFRATVYDADLIDRIGPEMGRFSNRAQSKPAGWNWIWSVSWATTGSGLRRWPGPIRKVRRKALRIETRLAWRAGPVPPGCCGRPAIVTAWDSTGVSPMRRELPPGQPERYEVLDLSYQHRGLLGSGSRISIGVQNLLDDETPYFSSSPNGGLRTFAYQEWVLWLSVGWVGD